MTTLNDQLNAAEDKSGVSTLLPLVFLAAIVVLGLDTFYPASKRRKR